MNCQIAVLTKIGSHQYTFPIVSHDHVDTTSHQIHGGCSHVISLRCKISQPNIVLGAKACCLAARKAEHYTEKVCKGTGMFWYRYIIHLLEY